MHITILLTLSIPPGEAELPVCVRYDAYLHPEPPGPDFLWYYLQYYWSTISVLKWSLNFILVHKSSLVYRLQSRSLSEATAEFQLKSNLKYVRVLVSSLPGGGREIYSILFLSQLVNDELYIIFATIAIAKVRIYRMLKFSESGRVWKLVWDWHCILRAVISY